MPPSDADTPNARSTPARAGAVSPLPSVSLSREHITEALAKSPDNGATLDLAHKNLTDVGEDGAEELATVGREDDDACESPLVRYDPISSKFGTPLICIPGLPSRTTA